MASSNFLSADAMQAIIDAMLVTGEINGAGRLILTTSDGSQIDAGYVKGSSTPESIDSTPGTLARRNASGQTKFSTPTDPLHVSTKQYSDSLHTDSIQYTDNLESWIKVPLIIPTGADLNDYVTTGKWHQNQNAFAAAGTNYPVPRAGLLEVVLSGSFVYQTYSAYRDESRVFYRSLYSGVWGAWQTLGGGDVGWNSIALESGYERYGTTYTCMAAKFGAMVTLRGLVKPTSGVFDASTTHRIGYLPAGWAYPDHGVYAAGMTTSGDGGAAIVVSSSGYVDIRIGTTAAPYVGLSGVTYPAHTAII